MKNKAIIRLSKDEVTHISNALPHGKKQSLAEKLELSPSQLSQFFRGYEVYDKETRKFIKTWSLESWRVEIINNFIDQL